jgi:isocitrate dehydrogenase
MSKEQVGTKEFAEAVVARLGQMPSTLKSVSYDSSYQMNLPKYQRKPAKSKTLEGVDLFVHWAGEDPNELAEQVRQLNHHGVELSMITNRGIKVWPEGFKETFCTDHWRCRFKSTSIYKEISKASIVSLLMRAEELHIDVVKTENLYAFDGTPAYSLGQGQ